MSLFKQQQDLGQRFGKKKNIYGSTVVVAAVPPETASSLYLFLPIVCEGFHSPLCHIVYQRNL